MYEIVLDEIIVHVSCIVNYKIDNLVFNVKTFSTGLLREKCP